MKYFILTLSFILVFGCGNWSKTVANKSRSYTFELSTVTLDFEREKTFEATLPNKGKKIKKYPQNGKIYIEYQISYPDSSVFYLSNDIWNGSRLNAGNLIAIGIHGHTKENLLDSTSYSGVQENGRFWKEQFKGEIVVGYYNTSPSMKSEFESAFSNIHTKIK